MDAPQQVARFYGTVCYAKDVIQNRRIAFVPVSMLNDPFDPYCFFETDFGESYQNLIAHVRNSHPSDLPLFSANVTPQSLEEIIKGLKELMQRVRKTTFVFSTTTAHSGLHPKDNLYMWGHYANGHRGLCIEFDKQALANAVLKNSEAENGKPSEDNNVWAKIEYAKKFGPITAEHFYEYVKQKQNQKKELAPVGATTQIESYFKRMSIIKNDVWRNENEWRLMWENDKTDGGVYKCPIGEDAIASGQSHLKSRV